MENRIFLLILLFSSFLNDVASSVVPTGLMVNYKLSPSMGILILSPMAFTWIVPQLTSSKSSSSSGIQGEQTSLSSVLGRQTSYQIVITSVNDGNDTVIWDSELSRATRA